MHPEELFELFYKNVRLDMNPVGFPKYYSEVMKRFWYERFMNVIYAELSGDFPLGDSRQPIYKSLRPF
ncbi:hypothetical protein RFH60_10620, partial [Acinetobacter baumannii]|nr:hypothetical protein [Acinetobacter baumannii]MDQ9002978.1 hypothetical protein [Acinetobacter baumannii]